MEEDFIEVSLLKLKKRIFDDGINKRTAINEQYQTASSFLFRSTINKVSMRHMSSEVRVPLP